MQRIAFCGNLYVVKRSRTNTQDPGELLEHSRRLQQLARSLASDEAIANDLVQDTLRVAIERRSPIENVRAFLAGTMRRLAMREHRSADRRRRREQHAATPKATPTPDQLLERLDLLRVVLEELRAMPAVQQRTLTLHFLDERSIADIARSERSTESTVRSNLSRGIAQLRTRLDRRLGDRMAWAPVFALPASLPIAPASTSAPLIPKLLATSGAIAMSNATIAFAAVTILAVGAWLLMDFEDAKPTFANSENAQRDVSPERAAEPRTNEPTREAVATAVSNSGAEEVPRSPVTGSVIDKHTGEPVPQFQLWLHAGETQVPMITDDDGAFASDTPLPHGEVGLGLASGQPFMPVHWGAAKVTFPLLAPLQVEVGPTFTFANRFAASVDVNELRASLHATAGSAKDAPRGLRTRVHAEPQSWVRFPFDAALLSWNEPFLLKVRDRTGYWLGTAQVTRTLGIEPTPVLLDVTATGVAKFELTGVSKSVMTHVSLEMTRKAGGERQRRYLRTMTLEGQTPDDSHTPHLLPGDYSWSIEIAGEQRGGDFRIVANETTNVAVDASQTQPTFSTTIYLNDASGELDCSDAFTWVNDPTGRDASFNAKITRLEGSGRGKWAIQLEDIGAHDWQLKLGQPISKLMFEPSLVTFGPGTTPPVIEVKSRGPQSKVQVTINSAVTGEPLPLGAVSFWIPGGGGGGPGRQPDGSLSGFEIPQNMTTRVYAWAPGHRLQMRDCQPARDGDELVFELRPGWGTCVRVWFDGGRLPGAEVLVDGQVVGVTDELGTLCIDRDVAPTSVTVRADGYTLKPPRGSENGGLPKLSAFGMNFVASRVE